MEALMDKYELKSEENVGIIPSFWKSLFSITTEQVMMIDTRGRVLFTNKGLFNISAKDAIGKSIFLLVPSSYAIILKNKLEEVNKIQAKVTFESLVDINGSIKHLELVIDPVLNEEQILQGYSLASIDTTQIKQAHRKYNYKSNLEKLFLNISTKFINLPVEKVDNGINESLELISRFTHSEHAYIVLFNKGFNQIGYEWHSSNVANVPFCNIDNVKSLLENTIDELKDNDPILIKPYDSQYRLGNDCPILVNPMILESQYYGALVLVGKTNSEEGWSKSFAKPMMLFSNVFINTMERKKNALAEKQREQTLEKAIKERTYAIEEQRNELLIKAKELAKTESLLVEANEKLKLANVSLEQTVFRRTSSLEKTNQELDRFVYSVSHDIKAPLASVKGLINLVRMSPADELDNSLNLMDKSIDKLNGFVSDILTHSRNSRLELKRDVINFHKEIEHAAEELRHMDKANEVKLITAFNQKEEVITDQYRLQSILKNLISNAVKYHNPDAKKSWVKVVVNATKERINIRVSDNGIGIGVNEVDRVFEMFYRASEKSFGSGLGLYIVKETIEKMNGHILVSSQEGVGATFSLNIPNLA